MTHSNFALRIFGFIVLLAVSESVDTLYFSYAHAQPQDESSAAPQSTMLVAPDNDSLIESPIIPIRDKQPLSYIEFTFYAEDFNNHTSSWGEEGYSGYSTSFTTGSLLNFSDALSGKLELDFTADADGPSLSIPVAWLARTYQLNKFDGEIKAGSIPLYDNRGWFYDSTFDGVHTTISNQHWKWFLSLGTETQDYLLQSTIGNPWYVMTGVTATLSRDQQLSALLVSSNKRAWSEDSTESNYSWLGLQAAGSAWRNAHHTLSYWAQAGFMRGKESNANITANTESDAVNTQMIKYRGWAYDLGLTLATDLPGRPEFSISVAHSSGDSTPGDTTKSHYRQPDYYSNSASIGSTSSTAYYGSALAPELSNLQIGSAGITLQVLSASYVSVFYHRYQQINPATTLNYPTIDLALTGNSNKVGEALDIELSIWESSRWYSSLLLGFFLPGDAVEKPHPRVSYGLFEISFSF